MSSYYGALAVELDSIGDGWKGANFIVVVVLAAQDAGFLGIGLRDTGDVDEEPVPHIDPSRIDNVHAIASNPLPRPRIHIQQIFPIDLLIDGGVLMARHVVFLPHHLQCIRVHLYINIPIPR